MTLLALLACRAEHEPDDLEPLAVPADLAATGVPVGVRTELVGDLVVEVWYPASDETTGAPETVDFGQWVPPSVVDLLGPVVLPPVPTIAHRDGPVRRLAEPVPAVVFSHGFGGTRAQSVDLTAHLASRGYVVVATDHAGRSMADLLPCLFAPPAEGCALATDDPAVGDVIELAGWLEDPPGWLGPLLDGGPLGLVGHSAGAGTTVTVGNSDDRFGALVPMAGGDEVTSGAPTLRLAGTCDGIVPADGSATAHAASAVDEVYVELLDAGHLAFSDLCELELGALGETLLADRDDTNALLVDQLLALGTDGCPGRTPAAGLRECGAGYLDLPTSDRIVRWTTTAALDRWLKGTGDGPGAPPFDEAAVR